MKKFKKFRELCLWNHKNFWSLSFYSYTFFKYSCISVVCTPTSDPNHLTFVFEVLQRMANIIEVPHKLTRHSDIWNHCLGKTFSFFFFFSFFLFSFFHSLKVSNCFGFIEIPGMPCRAVLVIFRKQCKKSLQKVLQMPI